MNKKCKGIFAVGVTCISLAIIGWGVYTYVQPKIDRKEATQKECQKEKPVTGEYKNMKVTESKDAYIIEADENVISCPKNLGSVVSDNQNKIVERREKQVRKLEIHYKGKVEKWNRNKELKGTKPLAGERK